MTQTKRALLSLLLAGLPLFGLPLCANAAANLAAPGRPTLDRARDLTTKPLEVLKAIPLKPGMAVLDLLGGNGYFAELAAQEVGRKGKVYLHNNKPYLADVAKPMDARLAGGRLPNVVRHDRELDNLDLPENSLDAILFVQGYHDMYYVDKGWPKIDAKHLLGQLRKALKPGGLLLVLDHAGLPGSNTTQSNTLHRIDEEYVVAELGREGFALLSRSGVLRNPEDKHRISVFDPSIRFRTDRFILLFKNMK